MCTTADNTMTLTCPTIEHGNANVSNGLDIMEQSHTQNDLDIEGAVQMATGQKIQWVNTGTYISGTDAALTIDCDNTLTFYCDTSMTVSSPLIDFYSSEANGTDFKIRSTNTSTGNTKLTLISRNGNNFGDTWQIKNDIETTVFK